MKNKKNKINSMLIFGHKSFNNDISSTYKYRLDRAIHYLKTYSPNRIIITGGHKDNESKSKTEAILGKEYLFKNNIKNNILIEDKSSNTFENIINSAKYIVDHKVLLISSPAHLRRCRKLFEEFFGFSPIYNNDEKNINEISEYELKLTNEDLLRIKKWKNYIKEKVTD